MGGASAPQVATQLDAAQLAKFGLNTSTNQDVNSLSEKWEAISLIPLKDPANPDDYLMLLGNDNDFKSDVVYHNGVPVGTNAVQVDIMLLAYRVTLPGVSTVRAANAAPTIAISLPSGTSYAQGTLPLTATVADTDGIVVKVEFFEDGLDPYRRPDCGRGEVVELHPHAHRGAVGVEVGGDGGHGVGQDPADLLVHVAAQRFVSDARGKLAESV